MITLSKKLRLKNSKKILLNKSIKKNSINKHDLVMLLTDHDYLNKKLILKIQR